MDYKEILNKALSAIKKTTTLQRIGLSLLAVILFSVGVYFYNPAKKMREWRNSQRRDDISQIINAVYQYSADNGGSIIDQISNEPKKICRSKATCEGIDFSMITTDKKYNFSDVPIDPQEQDKNSSGYEISKLASGRIKVSAPHAENNATITISK